MLPEKKLIFKKKIAVFRTNHKKHVCALWGKIQSSVTLKQVGYIVTKELQEVKIYFLISSPVSQLHGTSCGLMVHYASAEPLSGVLNI